MSSPVETEIKLELPAADVRKLNELAAVRRAKSNGGAKQVSVYFDTDKFALRKSGVTFRVRRNGSQYVQTVKAPGNGLLDRTELETELKGSKPDFSAIRHTTLRPLFTKALRKTLRPVFETRIDRTSYPLKVKQSQLELTLDRGKIGLGNRSRPVCEIEIELKAGDKAELFKLARTISRLTTAEVSVKSKAQRGYELLDDDENSPAKADAVNLSADTATRDAFALIAASCIRQVIANKPAVLAGDPEGIHQMRVGLRRLRTSISLFSEILEDSATNAIKSELRWLTEELAPAREFEVLLTRVVAPARRHHARLMGMQHLSRELAKERKLSNERARDAVCSERFRRLLLRVAAWLEIGGWRNPHDDLLRKRGDTPIAASAAMQLQRRSKKIRKRSRLLPKLDQHERHKLRIQAKKLRYAAEFFEAVFAGKRPSRLRKSYLAALEKMQDRLGDLNDIAVHESLTADIALDPAPHRDSSSRSRRAFAAGVLTGREEARLAAVLSAAVKASDRFAKAKPFWK